MASGLDPVKRGSMQQEVTVALREAITSGRLAPGSRLVEQELSRALSVSRAPIREALRELVGEGLVVNVPHKGTSVVELSAGDIIEIARLRAAIETLAIERLIELDNAAHPAELRKVVEQIRASLPDRDPLIVASLDMRFHERMCELTGMPRLVHAWRGLGNQLRSYFTVATYFYDDASLIGNHEEVVAVIEAGDLPLARKVIERHILAAGETMARHWTNSREGGGADTQTDVAAPV